MSVMKKSDYDQLTNEIISALKLADKRLGLLINFNVPLLKAGIRRRVNKLIE